MSKTFIKKQLAFYNSCNVLPLKIFYEIAETGNVKLLGEGDVNKLTDTWEEILLEYGEIDSNTNIKDTFDKVIQVSVKAAVYVEVNAMLLYLKEVDYKQEYIDRLAELGYKIDGKEYIKNIEANERKVKNIFTKIQFLKKDLEQNQSVKKTSSFDESMAWISANLNFWPPDDITVTRFIQLKKQINERNKPPRHNNR